MIYKTLGILLKRKPFGEYNEFLEFFTINNNKLKLFSFGSKSPKSSRNAILASYDWVKIFYTIKKGKNELISLELYKKNDTLNNVSYFHFFSKALKTISQSSFFEENTKETFLLLYYLSRSSNIHPNIEIHQFIFYFSLLKIIGYFPYFSSCYNCQTTNSHQFYFNIDLFQFYCSKCSFLIQQSPINQVLNNEQIDFLKYFYHAHQNSTIFYQNCKIKLTDSISKELNFKDLIFLAENILKRI